MNYSLEKILIITFWLFTSSCVSDFAFSEVEAEEYLVVEGFVSDVAYVDFHSLPTDPRYFEVKLKLTSEVTNVRDELVTGAEVTIVNDLNEHWDYVEDEEGTYRLYYNEFNAELDRMYKLEILLPNGEEYASDYQSIQTESLVGKLTYEEVTKDVYEIYLGEETIRTVMGLNLFVDFGTVVVNHKYYQKWDFSTSYSVIARLNPTETSPVYRCWITEELYFNHIILSEVEQIQTNHELLFFDASDPKIHEGISILVRQQTLNEAYYNYWNGIEQQSEQGELFSDPPVNLLTNMHAVGHEKLVFGYFGVVKEDFYRWTFSDDMVSYDIVYPESLINSCNVPLPSESCYDCTKVELVYESSLTNIKPDWWEE